MIPPRKIQFFFTCNDEQVASQAHERVVLYDNNMIRQIQLGPDKIDCYVEERNVLEDMRMGKVVDENYRVLVDMRPREPELEYKQGKPAETKLRCVVDVE